MSGTLPERLLDTGILQFGYFVNGKEIVPVRFCPEYLPAYPELLAKVARLVVSQCNVSNVHYWIAMADSVPLGVVCSVDTGLPLVYARGRGEAVVYDLVGSYNSGHMSALLLNCIEDIAAVQRFMSNVRSVGLDIQAIITVLEIRPVNQLAGIPVQSVFRLVDIVQELVGIGRLSKGQAQAVLAWIRIGEDSFNHHPS